MKHSLQLTLSFLIMAILFLPACNDDEDAYKTILVDFYLEHPDFQINDPVFETFTEQVLVKDAHNEGAIFETVSEQVLKSEGYSKIKIVDIQNFNVISDAEDNLACGVPCISYLSEEEFEYAIVEPKYVTRTYQKVVEPGSGDFIDASYTFRDYMLLVTDASVEQRTDDQINSVRKYFKIPSTTDFDSYWNEQLDGLGYNSCGSKNTYRAME